MGKRVTSLLLSIVMVFTVFGGVNLPTLASTNGITQSQAVAWAEKQASNPKDYDGVYGVQCVDLAVGYYKFLGNKSPGGNGKDYATNKLPSGWQRIKNHAGFVPKPGDIAVWTKTGSVYGHVAIVLSANTSSLKVSEFLGSNHTARIHTYKYSYGTFYGVIRPDFVGDNIGYDTGDLFDFSGTFKVMCSSKSVRSGPGGSSGTTRTVYKDNQVKVVGYVYNEYGNLWYKTDKGDYIHPTYLYALNYSELPPSNYCNAEFEVKCASKTSKSDPVGSSDNVKTYTKGNKIKVVGYVYNEYGNLWYETSDGSYIYCNYLSVISSDERTPSNYLDTKMKVMASSKAIRYDPDSSAEEKGKVYKNDIVSVKGYLYNRYGNLWYVLDGDGYIYSNYLQQVNNDSKIPSNYEYARKITTAEKDYKSEPYSVADLLEKFTSGEKINTIGYVINLFGNKWYECEDGGFVYDSDLACQHNYTSKVTKSPTCTENGTRTFSCSFCGSTYTEKIPANGHKYTTKVVKATCTADGYTQHICSVCSYSYKDSVVKAFGHSYTSTVTKEPTCTQPGTRTFKCSICGNTYTESIAATGHKTVVDKAIAPTCTEDGKTEGSHCSVCGEVIKAQEIIKATGHTPGKWITDKEATCKAEGSRHQVCTVCGETLKTETIVKKDHNIVTIHGIPATCTEDGKTEGIYCSVCGSVIKAQEVLPATGHTDADNDGICDTCGKDLGHGQPSDPSCDCICHKTGFAGFIYKIIRVFWKLFRINKTCSCGAVHY